MSEIKKSIEETDLKWVGCGKDFDSDHKKCGEEIEEGLNIVWLCPECEKLTEGEKEK